MIVGCLTELIVDDRESLGAGLANELNKFVLVLSKVPHKFDVDIVLVL